MAELTFYTNPMSRGRIVRWMLEETGIDYDVELLDYAGSLKGDAYRAINPMQKVPAIVHHGQVVTECAAICLYLADAFPQADLAPPPPERADYYRWMFFAAGPVEQAVTHRSMQVVPSAQQARMVGYGSYEAMVDTLEQAVSAHPYIAGDRFTAADVYVGSQVGWGLRFNTLPERPGFAAYWARLAGREALLRANAKDDALLPPQPQVA